MDDIWRTLILCLALACIAGCNQDSGTTVATTVDQGDGKAASVESSSDATAESTAAPEPQTAEGYIQAMQGLVKSENDLDAAIQLGEKGLTKFPSDDTLAQVVTSLMYQSLPSLEGQPDKLNQRRLRLGGLARALACLLYTSPSPRDKRQSRMPSSA